MRQYVIYSQKSSSPLVPFPWLCISFFPSSPPLRVKVFNPWSEFQRVSSQHIFHQSVFSCHRVVHPPIPLWFLFFWTIVPFLRSEPRRKLLCVLSDSAYRVTDCDLLLHQQSAETSFLGSDGILPALRTRVWLNIFLDHCQLNFFPEKQLMILDVPSETSDFKRRMSGISEESKPHTQHMFWTGHPNQMDSWMEVPVFWTLPNNSEYSDGEVRCPPENCRKYSEMPSTRREH